MYFFSRSQVPLVASLHMFPLRWPITFLLSVHLSGLPWVPAWARPQAPLLWSPSPRLKPSMASGGLRGGRYDSLCRIIYRLDQCFPILVLLSPPHGMLLILLLSDTHLRSWVFTNELMSWVRCVWLGRHLKCAVLGSSRSRIGIHWNYTSIIQLMCIYLFVWSVGCFSNIILIWKINK